MDAGEAARRWAAVWEAAWPAHDIEAIVDLYADDATYRALAFREPGRGRDGVREYLTQTFGEEEAVSCWSGRPLVDGDHAAVEWWATWKEDGQPLTLAGTTLLRLGADGLVVDHRDYWNSTGGAVPPFPGW